MPLTPSDPAPSLPYGDAPTDSDPTAPPPGAAAAAPSKAPAKSGTKVPIEIDMTIEKKHAGEVMKTLTDDKILGYVVVQGEPAIVSRRDRFTRNMGNFESISVEIGITLPCETKDINAAYADVSEWVGKRMEAEMLEIDSLKKGKPANLVEDKSGKKYKDVF